MSADAPGPERGDQPAEVPPSRTCFRESVIERVAKLLVRRGWTQPQGMEGLLLPRPPGGDPDLDSQALRLLGHARDCFRCRDVLHLFAVVEEDFRRTLKESPSLPVEVADLVAADAAATPLRIIQLHPPRPGPGRRPPANADELRETEYAWAAATPGDDPPPELTWDTRVLTLGSDDGRFLVRIFPNESGNQATAVLVNEEVPGEWKGLRPRPFLRIGGREYAFDAQDIARLPVFPVETIELIYRSE